MAYAIVQRRCPFCGNPLGDESIKIAECYSDIMKTSLMSSEKAIDFDRITDIMSFIFGPNFEEEKTILERHVGTIAEITGARVENSDIVETSHEEIRAPLSMSSKKMPFNPPVQTSVRVKKKPISRLTSSGDSVGIGRNSSAVQSGDGVEMVSPSDAIEEASVDSSEDNNGCIVAEDAIRDLPPEFQERARQIRSEKELSKLMKDIALAGM